MSRYTFFMPSDCEWPFGNRDAGTDYDRTEPVRIMLSRCDLGIIDTAKRHDQTRQDFLQRLISENLRVIRDRGGK